MPLDTEIQKNLGMAKAFLEERDYVRAEPLLSSAESQANELGVDVTEIIELRKELYQIGMEEALGDAIEYAGRGWYSIAANSLDLAESYAELGGLEVPNKVKELRVIVEIFKFPAHASPVRGL
jgi:hypothetical protein